MKRFIPVALIFAWLAPGSSMGSTATNASLARQVTLALVPLEDLSGDTNAAHWQASLPGLLSLRLNRVRSAVRVLPKSSVEFAFRESGLTKGRVLSADQAQQLGKIIEAEYVVTGSYRRQGDQWCLSAKLVQTATGRSKASWDFASTNWLVIGDDAVSKILEQLAITPTGEEKERLQKPITKSPEAFELLANSYFRFLKTAMSIAEFEANIRRAIALDSESAYAWRSLARVLAAEGRLDESEAAADRAVQIDPENAAGYEVLATVRFSQKSYSSSKELLMTAMALDPEDDEVYMRLSDVCARLNQWDEAVSWLNKAESLAPYDPAIHAELGRAYADSGDQQKAFAELAVTERFAGPDFHNEQIVSEAYSHLNALPEEAEHLRRWIAYVEKSGVQDPTLAENKKALRVVEERLTPHFVSAKAPRAFTEGELRTAMNSRLTRFEQTVVINPLLCTPEMKQWAEQLTAKSTGQKEQAGDLFAGLIRRGSISRDFGGKRTAPEAFKDWADPKINFSCQEFTLLYLALARSVGLEAYFCYVTRDYRGNLEYHACAGVFFPDGTVLLVDPSYHWFGVPHQEFQFLDDLEVVGVYESQLDGLVKSLAALKLAPEIQLVHHNLAINLADAGLFPKAHQILDQAPTSESTAWQTAYTRAVVDEAEKNWNDAIAELRKSLQANPTYPQSRFLLGKAFFERQQYPDAGEQFRLSLQGWLPADLADEARQRILQSEYAQRNQKAVQ
jgi:tetratricopeptide (TPR) repeat protein